MEAKKLDEQKQEKNAGRTTREKVNNTLTEELFFGICAPIGSLKRDVIVTLTKILEEKFGYEVEVLKLTNYIEKYKNKEFKQIPTKTEAFSKIIYKINEGNAIRKLS